MTKKEIWAKAQGILETNGVDNIEVYNELEKLLGPKLRVADYKMSLWAILPKSQKLNLDMI